MNSQLGVACLALKQTNKFGGFLPAARTQVHKSRIRLNQLATYVFGLGWVDISERVLSQCFTNSRRIPQASPSSFFETMVDAKAAGWLLGQNVWNLWRAVCFGFGFF